MTSYISVLFRGEFFLNFIRIQTCEHKIFNPKTVAGRPIIIKNDPIAPPNSLDLVIPTLTFSGCSIILNSIGFLCSGANPYRRNVHMKYH